MEKQGPYNKILQYCYEREKSRYWCFAFPLLSIKIINKSYKHKTMQ